MECILVPIQSNNKNKDKEKRKVRVNKKEFNKATFEGIIRCF